MTFTHSSTPYQPLKTPTSIRLLKLHRNPENDSPITGHLHIVCLHSPDRPAFNTLSYTWGVSPPTHKILLNGHDFLIRPSLYPVLAAICDSGSASTKTFDPEAYYWIDAICINQCDDNERASQVSLMGRLYRSSSLTHVWLGTSTPQTDRAMDFFRTLASWRDRLMARPASARGVIPPELADPADWQAWSALLRSEWWCRVWSLQELVLSPQLTFHCGGDKTFSAAEFHAAMYVQWACNPPASIMGVDPSDWLAAWNRRRLQQWFDLAPERMGLVALMAYTSNYGVTDTRDRVFGMLGLVSAGDRDMVGRPSYTEDADVVFKKLVRSFIRSRDSLDIICFAEPLGGQKATLPSWVPDWKIQRDTFVIPLMVSQSGRTHIGNFRPIKGRKAVVDLAVYGAAGNSVAEVSISEDMVRLTCTGLLLDCIDGLGPGGVGKETKLTGDDDTMRFVQSTSLVNTTAPKDSDRPSTQLLLLDELVRCIVLDRQDRYLTIPASVPNLRNELLSLAACLPGQVEQISSHAYKWLCGWLSANASLSVKGTRLGDLVRDVAAQSFQSHPIDVSLEPPEHGLASRLQDTTDPERMAKRLMTTENGRLCMGPQAARKGDLVCILQGCSVPVVLRRTAEDEFVFVGECYVDGYMHGEALNEPRVYRNFVLV